jgi:hypothetical protein
VVVVSEHAGTLIVSMSLVMVQPKAKALQFRIVFEPKVIPAASIIVQARVELAPIVVAQIGVQNTSQGEAPQVSVTVELATVVRAPVILNIYVHAQLRLSPPDHTEAAPAAVEVQYTHGVYSQRVPQLL